MARSFIVYQGEDETPEFDLTDPTSNVHVKFEEMEAGGKAFRGESTSNTIPVRDQQGETGNELNLPGGLTHVSLSRGSRWEWLDGPDGAEVRMAAGRIGTKDYTRNIQKADRARHVVMQCGDRNEELQDIIVDAWDRPEESDVTRVLALLSTYLDGSPRATTVLADTYVSSDNAVTLPARLYDGTNPHSILQEIASFANKEFFVTIDDELWYDTADSDSYLAGLRISDRPDENTSESTTPGITTTRLYLSGVSSDLTADPAADAGWDTAFSGGTGEIRQLLSSPDSTYGDSAFSNVDTGDVSGVNSPYWRGAIEMDADLAATLAAGGARIEGHIRAVTRQGIGIEDGAQDMNSQVSVRVTQGDSTTIRGTALAMHSEAFSETHRWPRGGTHQNREFPPPLANHTLSAVPGAAAGDYLLIEVGTRNFTDASEATGGILYVTSDSSNDLGLAQEQMDDYNSWFDIGPTDEAIVPTFPPKWDVGPPSTEDGLELVSGLRLYYGQNGDYVHVTDPTTEAEYWHAERSFYTSDESITDGTKATVLAEAILQRMKFEDRTYNVSVGPLYNEHVGLLKPGQLIDIKARAIPDADDQYVSRRIAQLKWTTPRLGVFWAHMQLDRPLKEAPYGVGPKQSAEEIAKHTQASSSHTASQVTIVDAGGYYTATEVEAALQEIGAGGIGGGGVDDVTSHGSMGAAETFDFADGSDHEGTLNANSTFTFTGAVNGEAAWLTLKLTQDGTGGWTVTWPGSVVWPGGIAPTLSTDPAAVDVLTFFSYDGGSTWYGFYQGAGGAVGDLDDLTDVTITAPAEDDDLRYNGSIWVNDSRKWEAVTDNPGTGPELVFDGDDLVHEWSI